MENNKEQYSEKGQFLKLQLKKVDKEVRTNPLQPILTKENVLELLVESLEETYEKQRNMIEYLRDKLKIYVSLEESEAHLANVVKDYGRGKIIRDSNQIWACFVIYVSAEPQILYEIFQKAEQNRKEIEPLEHVRVEEIVSEVKGKGIKELVDGNEHKLEIYREERRFQGCYVSDRAHQYLPQRYLDSKVVSVFDMNGLGGYKIIPKNCRVDTTTLPVLNPRSKKPDKHADKEIRDWVDETIKVNEAGIELEKYTQKGFSELKDKIYMTLKYVHSDKNKHFPCKEFQGFIIVYMIETIVEGLRFWTEIDKDLFDSWDIDIEMLHSVTSANTLKEYAPIFRTSPDACHDINNNLLLGDEPQELANTYVLHNAKNFYGVGILAYPGMLDKIAELLDDDFYFYAKNSIYSTITPCNENYDGLLLKAPVNWNPMTCKECAFSPYVHKYDRKSKKVETVYYVNK